MTLAELRAQRRAELEQKQVELGAIETALTLIDQQASTIKEQDAEIISDKETIAAKNAEISRLQTLLAEPIPPNPEWEALWEAGPNTYGLRIQAKGVAISSPTAPGRVTLGTFNGRRGVKLTTLVGDNNVHGSGTMERTDLILANSSGAADPVFTEGMEQWWAVSVLFPLDFQAPRWHAYNLMGFHHTGPTGQGNFRIGFEKGVGRSDSDWGMLGFEGHGGPTVNGGEFRQDLLAADQLIRDRWYDFVLHVKWSTTSGFFDAWMDGQRKLSHRGPTLYVGMGSYLKLGNYHNPVCDPYPVCIGAHKASSIVYGKAMRGKTAESIGFTP